MDKGTGISRSMRAVAGLPVRILGASENFGIVEDFSCSGMFLWTTQTSSVGAELDVEIFLPNLGTLRLLCNVVRASQSASDSRVGLGVCFNEEQPHHEPSKMERLGQLLVDVRTCAEAVSALPMGTSMQRSLQVTPIACVLSCLEAESFSGRMDVKSPQFAGSLELIDGALMAIEGELIEANTSQTMVEVLLASTEGDIVLTRKASEASIGEGQSLSGLLWQHMSA